MFGQLHNAEFSKLHAKNQQYQASDQKGQKERNHATKKFKCHNGEMTGLGNNFAYFHDPEKKEKKEGEKDGIVQSRAEKKKGKIREREREREMTRHNILERHSNQREPI